MKNAFSRIGRTCAQVAMAGGLMAGVMLRGTGESGYGDAAARGNRRVDHAAER